LTQVDKYRIALEVRNKMAKWRGSTSIDEQGKISFDTSRLFNVEDMEDMYVLGSLYHAAIVKKTEKLADGDMNITLEFSDGAEYTLRKNELAKVGQQMYLYIHKDGKKGKIPVLPLLDIPVNTFYVIKRKDVSEMKKFKMVQTYNKKANMLGVVKEYGQLYLIEGKVVYFSGRDATSIKLPSCVDSVIATSFKEYNEFTSCTYVESIDMSDTKIEVLPGKVLDNAPGLVSIKLPETLKEMHEDAFYYNKLRELIIPGDLGYVGHRSITNTYKLERIEFTGTCQEIASEAFVSNHALKELILPRGLEVLNNDIVFDCENLETIIIQADIKKVSLIAFNGIGKNAKVIYRGNDEKVQANIMEAWNNRR
jgi:hypothetical protein